MGKAKRGFAALTPERRKEIASMGGKASRGGGRPRTPKFLSEMQNAS